MSVRLRSTPIARSLTGRSLDESCPVETHPERRQGSVFLRQGEAGRNVIEYAQQFSIPFVIVRPGMSMARATRPSPGGSESAPLASSCILGGSNKIPFTYVDNCADAIALAGLRPGVDGEVFNVVDDDLPSSRQFLRLYKRNVRSFSSSIIPHAVSYALCYLWERYSTWSEGQLPAAFNRRTLACLLEEDPL